MASAPSTLTRFERAALSAHVEARGRRRAGVGRVVADDLRIGQREVDVVASVDRKIVDAALADGVGRGSARGLDQFGLRADFDDFFASSDSECDRQLDEAADRDGDAGALDLGESGRRDGHGVGAGRKKLRAVSALPVAGGGALETLGDVLHSDGRVGDVVPLGSLTVTCRSPVATPPCANAMAESSRTKNDTRRIFAVRIIWILP